MALIYVHFGATLNAAQFFKKNYSVRHQLYKCAVKRFGLV